MEQNHVIGGVLAASLGVLIALISRGKLQCEEPADPMSTFVDTELAKESSRFLKMVSPPLDGKSHKGQDGRIAVIGGSADYTGAPYYAGQAALNAGADLLYLYTAREAASPIKAYSPELMVTPVYTTGFPGGTEAGIEDMVVRVDAMLDRFHAVVIGNGLGRDANVLEAVARIIPKIRSRNLPVVFDADGCWLIHNRPQLIQGYTRAIISPNKREYSLLCQNILGDQSTYEVKHTNEEVKQLSRALGNVTILKKGAVDVVTDGHELVECDEEGTPRRPGGIGDVLAGVLGTVWAWGAMAEHNPAVNNRSWTSSSSKPSFAVWSAAASSTIVRRASHAAFLEHKRATSASHILREVGSAMQNLNPVPLTTLTRSARGITRTLGRL